jgi:hypothetical protein
METNFKRFFVLMLICSALLAAFKAVGGLHISWFGVLLPIIIPVSVVLLLTLISEIFDV